MAFFLHSFTDHQINHTALASEHASMGGNDERAPARLPRDEDDDTRSLIGILMERSNAAPSLLPDPPPAATVEESS